MATYLSEGFESGIGRAETVAFRGESPGERRIWFDDMDHRRPGTGLCGACARNGHESELGGAERGPDLAALKISQTRIQHSGKDRAPIAGACATADDGQLLHHGPR